MRIDLSLGLLPLLLAAFAAPVAMQGKDQAIRGQVLDNGGTPLCGIGVEFRDALNAEILGTATTNLSGEFASNDLPAGTYRVRFWDELGAVPGKVVYPDYYKAGETHQFCLAAEVVLQPGETVSLLEHLKVSDPPSDEGFSYSLDVAVLSVDSGTVLEGIRMDVLDGSTAELLVTTHSDAGGRCSLPKLVLGAKTVALRFSDPSGLYRPRFLGEKGLDEFCSATLVPPDTQLADKVFLDLNTPAQQTEHLVDQIEALPLPTEVSNVLATPLTRAADLLADDNPANDGGVCHQLDSFITRVAIQEKKGRLTATEAADLIDNAKAIQQSMGCN